MTIESDLETLLGPTGWLVTGVEGYQTDWLGAHSHPPLGVARPKSTEEVAAIIGVARKYGVSVTPQGGNTSLCGASVPGMPGQIILSMSRMNKIEAVDPLSFSAVVEAGVVLANLHQAVAAQDLMFPMHLGSEGSAQIGGLISTNAGGSHALRYGMMQDLVLGLEVVLPDGQVWNGLRASQKDNSGYQLRKLFCGSEGTLGIVTRAVLRLYSAPKARATALLALDHVQSMVGLGRQLRQSLGEFISAMEFFGDVGLTLALRHVPGLTFPLGQRTAAYVLVELETCSDHVDLPGMLESALSGAFEAGLVVDGAIAANDAQRAVFWRLREEMPEGQRIEGAQIKHDIAVPVSQLGTFILEMEQKLEAILPGLRINPFGHLGDGNIHYNLTPPVGQAGFGKTGADLSRHIYAHAEAIGGSFAAEHGLGRSKVGHAGLLRSPAERQLMSLIKNSFDPAMTLNPGVVVSKGMT